MDALSVEVVGELRAQLKAEKARLERERANAELLELRQDSLKVIHSLKHAVTLIHLIRD